MKEIIDHQFNLEIYLKQREVATIKQEIAKAESILNDIKQAVENGTYLDHSHCYFFLLSFMIESMAASMPESAHYTRRSALYYHGGSQALVTTTNTTPKRKVYRNYEKTPLYGRRNDGVYVR